MDIINLKCGKSTAQIYTYGATVTSWCNNGQEKLFLSSKGTCFIFLFCISTFWLNFVKKIAGFLGKFCLGKKFFFSKFRLNSSSQEFELHVPQHLYFVILRSIQIFQKI